jgi:predicted ATPase
MIKQISAKNYRNLVFKEELNLKPLNVFVGSNGSGKSNLIRILQFFQDALIGSYDEQRGITRFQNAASKFGLGYILDIKQAKPAFVNLKISYMINGYDNKQDVIFHEVGLEVIDSHTVLVRKERLAGTFHVSDAVQYIDTEDDKVYEDNGLGDETFYEPNKGENNRVCVLQPIEYHEVPYTGIEMSPLTEVLPTNDLFFHTISQHYKIQTYSIERSYEGIHDEIMNAFTRYTFYESGNMNVSEIRKANPSLGDMDTRLIPSGTNLLSVLQNLITQDITFEDRLTEAFTELFPQTKRVRIIPVAGRTIQLEWHRQGDKTPLRLDDLSDGTLRMLCWCAVLLSPKPPTLIVIDEPESGIHPAWLRVLAGWIREASRHTQVIISTHSPDLLDYFNDDLDSIFIFRETKDDPSKTEIVPLPKERIQDKLDEGWKIGDLYRVGDPNIGGWPW